MKFGLLFTVLSFVLSTASPVLVTPSGAQEQNTENRFSITKTDNGYIRLDRKTGSVSLCTTTSSSVTCRLGADERQAYQREIDAINARIDRYEKRLSSLESRNKSATVKPQNNAKKQEEDFDRALKFADKAFRHFFNLMQDIKPVPKKDAI